MDMLENFEIKEDAPRYKDRAFFFALPYQGRAQLLEPPGSVEEKLLAHITWIRDNLHLLNDNSISDDEWINTKRIIGGEEGAPGFIWHTKGAHGGGNSKKKRTAGMSTD
jgi:hypothetical protein